VEVKSGFQDVAQVLRIRDFRYFLCSRFFATLATQMQALVVSWQIYQLTKDPLKLGLVGLVEAVVFIAFALWAGHFADRRDKKHIILTTQAVMLACSAGLLWISHLPHIHLLPIYAVIALTGLARSYMWPASFAYSELTVPREIYSRAATLNSTGWEIGSIVGPALGGILYAWHGPVAAYTVILGLMIVGLFFTTLMGAKPPTARAAEATSHDLLSGIRFVVSKPEILSAMTLDMFAVLFGGVYAILPLFADRLDVGARGLGLLRAAPSLGAILMAGYQAYRPPFKRVGKTLLMAVSCFGICIIAFALSKSFTWSLILLAASGMADNISVVIRASITQAFTPDAMRGRVSSVNGIFIGSSNEIGAFESGLAAKLMGTVPSVLLGGTMTLLTVAVMAWKSTSLLRLGALHTPQAK
jgi:MFS family permease